LNDLDNDLICDEIDNCVGQLDECGVCNGNGPEIYYDCNGNCLNDFDDDLICDEYDNCIDIYNPSQEDFDNDGAGNECSCEQIFIIGENVVESGDAEIYDIDNQIGNNYSWSVINGEIIWDSAENSSISILWGAPGSGTVIITQMYGEELFCETLLNVIIMPSSISIYEHNQEKYVIKATDILGREVDFNEKEAVLIFYYNDGSVQKIYNINY